MSTVLADPWRTLAPRGPFCLDDQNAYLRWRDAKLRAVPPSLDVLVVEVADPCSLTQAERAALSQRLHRANMALYASRAGATDRDTPRSLGMQLGLERLDQNHLADDDGISSIRNGGDDARREFIPYTDQPISWHTDGYYNPPERRIRSMILHCAQPAASGGVNCLLDHELVYIALRDLDIRHIEALSAPDAMTIPARVDAGGVARDAQTGPVFWVEPGDGRLHMRYTARTRSIAWNADPDTRAAVRQLEAILRDPTPRRFSVRMESGMGLVCANVLHNRTGFTDDPDRPRLLFRARYHDALDI